MVDVEEGKEETNVYISRRGRSWSTVSTNKALRAKEFENARVRAESDNIESLLTGQKNRKNSWVPADDTSIRKRAESEKVATIAEDAGMAEDEEPTAFETDVDRLASLYRESEEDMLADCPTDWKSRTEYLVNKISDEINRMLEYDDSNHDDDGDDDDEEEIVVVPEEEYEAVDGNEENEKKEETAVLKNVDEFDTDAVVEKALEKVMKEEGEDDVVSLLSYLSGLNSELDEESAQDLHETTPSSSNLTPYDIWKKSRGKKEEPQKPTKQLTEVQWKEVIKRMGQYQYDRELKQMKAQHKVLKHELSAFPFQPKINESSKRMSHVQPLHQRLSHVIALKQRKLDQERKRLEELEASQCPAKPQINKTKRWKAQVSKKYLNAHLNEFREEDAELTFSPKLNRKSAKLAAKASKEGTRLKLTEARKSTKKPTYKEKKPSFRPHINQRSKHIQRESSEPVFERLHKIVLKGQSQRRTIIKTKQDRPEHNQPKHTSNQVDFDESKHTFLLNILSRIQDEQS